MEGLTRGHGGGAITEVWGRRQIIAVDVSTHGRLRLRGEVCVLLQRVGMLLKRLVWKRLLRRWLLGEHALLLVLEIVLMLMLVLMRHRALRQTRRGQLVGVLMLGRSRLLHAQWGPGGHRKRGSALAMPMEFGDWRLVIM